MNIQDTNDQNVAEANKGTVSANAGAFNEQSAPEPAPTKPTKYFVDFENVHGAGLKGVDELGENDEVIIVYSQAAETFHIEHAISILNSKARVRFLEADAGTRNAADFQLIVALYGNMSDEFDYAIITGDGGFDAAIKMGERMGLPSVRRLANVRGDLEAEKPEKPKSRRSRRKRNGSDEGAASSPSEAITAVLENEGDPSPSDDAANEAPSTSTGESTDQPSASSRSRRRRGGRSKSVRDEAASAPAAPVDEITDKHAEQPAKPAEDTQNEPSAQENAEKSASSRRRPRRRKRGQDAQQASADSAAEATEATPSPATSAQEDDQPQNPTQPSSADPDEPATEAHSAETSTAAEPQTLAHIHEVLESRGIQLEEPQIQTLAKALENAQGRQGFYRNIIKIERQQRGRALYHQIRDCYEAFINA